MRTAAAFSLKKALADAAGFLPTAWRGAWLILLIMAAVLAAGPRLIGYAPHRVIAGVLLPVLWLLKIVALGALYRLAIFAQAARVEGLGPAGLQAGKAELRIGAAQIAICLFVLLIAVTLGVVFLIAFNLSHLGEGYGDTSGAVMAAFTRRQGADWIFIVYAVFAALAMVMLAVRLSLVYAATVAQRRLVTLNALGLSEGNGLKLLTGTVLLCLPLVLLAVLLHLTIHMSHMAVHIVLSLTAVLIVMPLSAGFFASAYRQILANRAK